MEKENFEVAIEAEYSDEMIRSVEKVLTERLPDYLRHKLVIIKLIDLN